jgi:hypothetical protein
MNQSKKIFCEHCEIKTEHELLFPSRGNKVIQFVAVCAVCLTKSIYSEIANDEEMQKVGYILFLCHCREHVRGKIISEKRISEEFRGKMRSYTEAKVECPRCHHVSDLVI